MNPPRQKALNAWQITQLVYEDILQNIDQHFDKISVTYMPLKGAFLIASGLSSKIPSRKMKDIDILVKKKDFKKVIQYFDTLEECKVVKGYYNHEQPFIYQCNNQIIYLEIKYQICASARFLLSDQDLFERGMKQKKHCILPHPADSMLIHICHYLHHIYQKFEQSFFDEMAVLESQKGFLWEDFWRFAEKTGIKPYIWFMVKMYAKIFKRNINIPDWSTWYTRIIINFSLEWFAGLKPAVRRVVLEIPFVRKPFWLLKYKLTK